MAKELTRVTPFRMIGNLYFVGTVEASSHLLATEEGLILIDTGYEESADLVVESMRELGFDIADVKYILHSHGHYDHTDATARLLELAPRAKTFLNLHDLRYIKGFTPDFDLRDGDVIRLGSTEILCLFTPGHTEGSVSFFFNVTENGNTYRAAMFGGAGVNQLKKAYMERNHVPIEMREAFFESVDRLRKEHVDVMVGNHTWHNHTCERGELLQTAKQNPFIDPTEWERFLLHLRNKLTRILEEEAAQVAAEGKTTE